MDEKGENALDVDDETAPEQSEKKDVVEEATTCGHDVHKSEAVVADKPASRVSLKERLESMKARVANGDVGKVIPQKGKEVQEAL